MRLVCLAAMVLGVKQTPSTNKGGSDGTAADGNGQRIEAEVFGALGGCAHAGCVGISDNSAYTPQAPPCVGPWGA